MRAGSSKVKASAFFGGIALLVLLAFPIMGDGLDALGYPLRLLSYALACTALAIGYVRSKGHGLSLWVSLIATAPLVPPLVSMDILGGSAFSSVGSIYQFGNSVTLPIFVAAVACLAMSLILRGPTNPEQKIKQAQAANIQQGTTAILLWFGLAMLMAIVSTISSDPNIDTIAVSTYREQKEGRIDALRFMAGFFMTACVIGLAAKMAYEKSGAPKRKKKFVSMIFVVVVSLCALWKLSHGSRIEIAGLGIFLWLLYGRSFSISFKWLVMIGVVLLMTIIGYSRNDQFDAVLARSYVSFPGGVENAMAGWVAAYWIKHDGGFDIVAGQTYAAELQRLPPRAFGMDRWPLAYDILSSKVTLIGGEYFPIEPVINFGVAGLAFYVLIFCFITNRAWRSIDSYRQRPVFRECFAFILSSIWISHLFRTLWYGLDNVFKAEIVALVFATAVLLTYPPRSRHSAPQEPMKLRHLRELQRGSME